MYLELDERACISSTCHVTCLNCFSVKVDCFNVFNRDPESDSSQTRLTLFPYFLPHMPDPMLVRAVVAAPVSNRSSFYLPVSTPVYVDIADVFYTPTVNSFISLQADHSICSCVCCLPVNWAVREAPERCSRGLGGSYGRARACTAAGSATGPPRSTHTKTCPWPCPVRRSPPSGSLNHRYHSPTG